NPHVIDIRSRRRSRFIVLGTLALVGIAAAMFIGRVSGPESGSAAASPPPAPVTTPALTGAASGYAPGVVLLPPEPAAEEVSRAAGALPLVPGPVGRPPDLAKSLLVLRKAVERHPELVQGPELDDRANFLVSMTMRTDGGVINSAAELASPATYPEIS